SSGCNSYARPQLACPGVGRTLLNVACSMLSNFEPMRLTSISLLIAALSTMSILAATPEIAPTPTVPAAAAAQGKHVVHQLKDGREFSGKVVGTDEKTDIAVIKIDAKDLPIVQLGDSDAVRVGQFAFAIGAPFKLDYTFTYGVVSGKGRSKLLATSGYSISD